MKDQYFGDEGDFVKYGLLRALAAEGLSLCIAWMKTEDTGTHGGDTSYLRKPDEWRDCDPELFDLLKVKVDADDRTVGHLEASSLLTGAVFVDAPFTGSNRDDYMRRVALAVQGRDIVFLDPDNGIGTEKTKPSSDKHLLTADIQKLSQPDRSLVIFQHYPRGIAKLDECVFVEEKVSQLYHCVPAKFIASVRAKRIALLIAVLDQQEEAITKALGTFQETWGPRIQVCKHMMP